MDISSKWFLRPHIFPLYKFSMGNKLFSCLQFSKNVNFDSSKINGRATHISILFLFQENASLTPLTFSHRQFHCFSCLQLSFCSIKVFTLISSRFRFCPFFGEEFFHQSKYDLQYRQI